MNMFISWSKQISGRIATVLGNWLPLVNPYITPFVSTIDISAGAKWPEELDEALNQAQSSIVCLTEENLDSDLNWVNYETGRTSAYPIACIYFSRRNDQKAPEALRRFQGVQQFTRQNMWKLMQDINRECRNTVRSPGPDFTWSGMPLSREQLQESFNELYEALENRVRDILSLSASPIETPVKIQANLPVRSVATESTEEERFSASVSSENTSSSEIETCAQNLEKLYRHYGYSPDIGRIYYEGLRAKSILTDETSEKKKKETTYTEFTTILTRKINKLSQGGGAYAGCQMEKDLRQLQDDFRSLLFPSPQNSG